MTNPLTPPPGLVASLRNSAPHGIRDSGVTREVWLINHAYSAGADQELEECCEWLANETPEPYIKALRTARRPNPPSLKEQALEQLDGIAAVFRMSHGGNLVCDTIRRALEALPE